MEKKKYKLKVNLPLVKTAAKRMKIKTRDMMSESSSVADSNQRQLLPIYIPPRLKIYKEYLNLKKSRVLVCLFIAPVDIQS